MFILHFISHRSFEVYLGSAMFFWTTLAFNLAGVIPMGSAPSVTTESVVKRRSVRGASRTSANGGVVAGFFSPRRRGDSHPQQMGFELQQKLGFGRWPLGRVS